MKLILLKRKILSLGLCLLCSVAMFYIVNHPAVIGAAATTRQLPIYCMLRDQKVVSLSFDAAWGNEDTQQLIDILGKYNVKVTFFVVGEWVDKYPESVKALADAGHEIMNHSNDHAHFNSLSSEEIVADINTCNDKIAAITGARPTLFRPPYGEYDDHVITAVRGMGMEPIQWDVEGLCLLYKPCGARVFKSLLFKNFERSQKQTEYDMHFVFSKGKAQTALPSLCSMKISVYGSASVILYFSLKPSFSRTDIMPHCSSISRNCLRWLCVMGRYLDAIA